MCCMPSPLSSIKRTEVLGAWWQLYNRRTFLQWYPSFNNRRTFLQWYPSFNASCTNTTKEVAVQSWQPFGKSITQRSRWLGEGIEIEQQACPGTYRRAAFETCAGRSLFPVHVGRLEYSRASSTRLSNADRMAYTKVGLQTNMPFFFSRIQLATAASFLLH